MSRTSTLLALGLLALVVLLMTPFSSKAEEKKGTLRTRIDPPIAGVFIDGKYQGTAATFASRERAIRLAPGDYTVTLRDPRYKDLVAKVKIEAERESVIRRRLSPGLPPLEPPYGELKTEGFGNAAVYLDGRYSGNAMEFDGPGQALLLKPREYDLKIEPVSEGSPHQEKVTIREDQVTTVKKE